MTLDERLEAMSRDIELLLAMQHSNERRFEEIGSRFEEMGKRFEDMGKQSGDIELLVSMQHSNEERFATITRNFEIVHDSIVRLERIAVAHEERLDGLEGQ